MGDKIIYATTEEQIEKLKDQCLTIKDEQNAKHALDTFGYSNLIKSYRDPYTINSNGKKQYRSDVTFEQIFSLYMLDKNLRNAVMASMQDLEEHIKEVAANVIAQSYGLQPDNYLAYRNYRNKRKRKPCFTLPKILDTIKKSMNTDKEPIHHYIKKYSMVPPWILFKSVYFSTIVNFIDLFKISDQRKMTEYLYDSSLKLPPEALCKLMMDTLFICLEYRNISAHGGRIYNYDCTSRLRNEEIFEDSEPIQFGGFSKLLFLLNLFKYQNPYIRLSTVLKEELTRHCIQFPQDVTYLSQILNIDIIPKTIVHIGKSSKIYHLNKHCCGIISTKQLDISEAEEQGYKPCKKCCKH